MILNSNTKCLQALDPDNVCRTRDKSTEAKFTCIACLLITWKWRLYLFSKALKYAKWAFSYQVYAFKAPQCFNPLRDQPTVLDNVILLDSF